MFKRERYKTQKHRRLNHLLVASTNDQKEDEKISW